MFKTSILSYDRISSSYLEVVASIKRQHFFLESWDLLKFNSGQKELRFQGFSSLLTVFLFCATVGLQFISLCLLAPVSVVSKAGRRSLLLYI